MKIKAIKLAPGASFLPELNDGDVYWICPQALTVAKPFLDVPDRIAARLIGAYPDNFEIVQEGKAEAGVAVSVDTPSEPMAAGIVDKQALKTKMADKYSKTAAVEE